MRGALGRITMYRLVLAGLAVLAALACVLSFFGLIGPEPASLLLTAAVLVGVGAGIDMVVHRLRGAIWRPESTLITAGILLFVLRPGSDVATLLGAAVAAVAASASKHLLVWRGRHLLNPAAVGATVATLVSLTPVISGGSAWWVGTPWLFVPVLFIGGVVAWRTERIGVVSVFLLVAVATSLLRTYVQLHQLGATLPVVDVITAVVVQSPVLFLGAFMLTEPLTLPPRRRQQVLIAVVVGLLVGWPISVGVMTLGQERALLIGNLIAAAFVARGAIRMTLARSTKITPTVRELSMVADRPFRFVPGQFLELDIPHPRPDARGSRREFSIVSAPEDMPEVRIAYRERAGDLSTFKHALTATPTGSRVRATGVWGDFFLPRRGPVLLVAAGIGITPIVSQLRHDRLARVSRDVVLVYVASCSDELAYRDDIARCGVPVHVVVPDRPAALPTDWTWSGDRLTAEALLTVVPDLADRHAFVSGPPALIAGLAPALGRARKVTTDAFSGY
ncbi:FAD-dependent oxidoreductase [Microbacterium amylolyticum]|uniref:Ferredoxin-NADP reductase n=1 Tax=Microbacterium amylolyticum TaxID=936337 RepID=A0ABS4ZK63_9MICO|nr:FAD-dependent oxidoreductase [Microbacterium amylolyticum]MBP2437682.1 ferredoxin-NADP reductase [Microbacterium amylolyticum]